MINPSTAILKPSLFGLSAVLLCATLAVGASSPPPKSGTPAVKTGAGAATPAAPSALKLRYNRDIRPILAENCFPCHGPDSAARKAGLRLDRFADATADRGGHAAIAAGKPDASEAVRRVSGLGPVMPPPGGIRKPLTLKQIATLRAWVAQGAAYELHWSYQAPQRPPLPHVSAKNAAWVRNPIDRFILAKLEQKGLTPAPEADRRTLARRLSLDLTGLPPEPADVEAFVRDKSPNAYEKLVDKFLAMPQWGEQRGRYWLDAARYGDTHGIHMDNYREIWSYRDWVIKAFNRNMPFDQFTVEQIAGDLLPNPTLDQRIATGFNRCNITSSEGGAIDEEYRVLYARDRTETTSQVWLGTTLGCAVCHDHKFDPFTQKDFYSFSAFFNNTTQPAMDGNIQNTPPVIVVPQETDRARYSVIKDDIAAAQKAVDDRKIAAKTDFAAWSARVTPADIAGQLPSNGLLFQAPLDEGQGRQVRATANGATLQLASANDPGWDEGQVAAKAYKRMPGNLLQVANVGDFERDQSFSYAAWVKIPGNITGAIMSRMDEKSDYRGWDLWIENGRVGTHIISKWPDNALKTVSNDTLSANKWHHVCITYGGGSNTNSIHIYVDGVLQTTTDQANSLKGSIRTGVSYKIGQRSNTSGVDGVAIQDARLYNRILTPDEIRLLGVGARAAYIAAKQADQRGKGTATLSAPEQDELFAWYLNGSDEAYRTASAKLAGLQNEERDILARGTQAHVMQDRNEEAMAYILARGDYDKRRDKVTPITPAVLPPMPAGVPKNRLGLAKWLVAPDNPLTARVTVNRFWQELFGQGLVVTAGDFGVTGTLPTHPELLDWMAVEFREGGWDIKKFYKLLVTSAAYRQAAIVTPEKAQKDPKNQLLSRGPRFRMDAEMVRDYALAASGLLVRKLGGPSVKPYQPDGIWESIAMDVSNTHFYKRDNGDSLYRRSMYTFWKRSAPPASMDIFNAPSRQVCTMRRERTDTPLQALVTLNDVQFVEAARFLAQRALKEGGATEQAQEDFIARRLLARPLRPAEQSVVSKSLADLKSFYDGHPKDAQALIMDGESKPDPTLKPERLAAWTMLTNQLMNLDEVLNK
jgi:hypothetical protein